MKCPEDSGKLSQNMSQVVGGKLGGLPKYATFWTAGASRLAGAYGKLPSSL